MKKRRNALFAVMCLTGMLSACGESPMAPSADVPLMGAEAGNSKDAATGTTSTTTATTTEESTKKTNTTGPNRTMNSGYILGMD